MPGFDYSRLDPSVSREPPKPVVTPVPTNRRQEPDLVIFAKSLNLAGLGDFYNEGGYTPPQEPKIPPLVEGDSAKTFLHHSVRTNLLKEGEAYELLTKLRGHPAAIDHLNQILSRRNTQFSAGSDDLRSYLRYHHGDITTSVVPILKALSETEDNSVIDSFMSILCVSSHSAIRSKIDSNPSEAIPKMLEDIRCIKALLGRTARIGGYGFPAAQVALHYSQEPAHDLALLDSTFELRHKPSAEELARYYTEGHRFIAHGEIFGMSYKGEESKIPVEIRGIRERLSKSEFHPAPHLVPSLAEDIAGFAPEGREVIFKLIEKFHRDRLPFSYLSSFGDALRKAGTDQGLLSLAESVTNYSGDNLILAISVFEDIVHQDAPNAVDYQTDMRAGNLADLERRLYQHRLKEQQEKFPERPLEEVLNAFRTKKFPESEAPSTESLQRAEQTYREIQIVGAKLLEDSKPELLRKMKALKANAQSQPREEFRVHYFAMARELFKREFGVYPYNTQMLVILLLSDEKSATDLDKRGLYAEVKTGEGKSLILALSSGYHAALGKKVEVITSNSYLAKRDMLRFESLNNATGNSCGNLDNNNIAQAFKENPDILYTTNDALIYTLLRCRDSNVPFFQNTRLQVALVDESDNLCIDRTGEECRLATAIDRRFSRETLEQMRTFAREHAAEFKSDSFEATVASFRETNAEVQTVHPLILSLYLRSALRADELVENEDYVIKDNKEVIVVDVDNTGRLQHRMHWAHGLHEFVALKHGIEPPAPMGTICRMGHPAYLRMYKELYCITGTMGDAADRAEIQEVYNLVGFDAPSHHPSKRIDYPASIFETETAWLNYLERSVRELTTSKPPRPVLLVCGTVRESQLLHEYLKSKGLLAQLLNDHNNQDAEGTPQDEQALIGKSGIAGTITIATSVAGRGADIIPDELARKAGGLHTILTFLPPNKRIEFQARGRSGRQGMEGSSEIAASIARDRFYRDLPHDAQAVLVTAIQNAGPNSDEVNALYSFTRTCSNVLWSSYRRVRLEKDETAQTGLTLYYRAKSALSEKLFEHNHAFPNSEMAHYVISLFMSSGWGNAFDEFDTVLTADGRMIVGAEAGGEVQVYESNAPKRILQAFQSAIGMTLKDAAILPDTDWRRQTAEVAKHYLQGAIAAESRRLSLDPRRVAELIARLEARIETLTQECFTKFQKLPTWEINHWIEQEEKKRKERNKKQGDSSDGTPQ